MNGFHKIKAPCDPATEVKVPHLMGGVVGLGRFMVVTATGRDAGDPGRRGEDRKEDAGFYAPPM